MQPVSVTALLVGLILSAAAGADDAALECGFARVDITPTEPVRLSGYGNRSEPYTGIDTPLYARAMAIREGDGPVHILVSVDTIGFPAALTDEILDRVRDAHGIERRQLVIACTHSHTAPHIGRGLDNLYSIPQSADERAATERYTDQARDGVVQAIGNAIASLSPASISTATGSAHFAVNRRVLQDGKWTGFGINPAGPVDHALPVLVIKDAAGEQIRGIVFNYACHCTTFGGEYNRVNGDWAGYAAAALESSHAGAVAMCTIGCGADANPERVPERALAIAEAQGMEIHDEVQRLVDGELTPISGDLSAGAGFAGLPIDRPSREELRESLKSERPQVRQHAQTMLDTWDRMGRLPETYPMPINVWRFGESFAMVFLSGEVCVDYAHRIKRELEGTNAWVSGYTNDVFGYVASERMRDEGGYEVDFSMIYYNQPGRWSTGTEDVILRRVHELYDHSVLEGPLSPEDALRSFTVPDGFAIEIVAAEPLIADPVNFAVGPDGRLWVAEMGDYPRGAHDDGEPGGRIRVLTDVDGDGRYDEAVTFLDGLVYPTGVMPWRDGALITAAPEIFFAADRDGDGQADERRVLYTGFVESNPQHRINGFAYGLDNWLYLGAGASSGDITCVLTGDVVNVSGRDSRIKPDEGLLEAVSGDSQYGRTRDDWGNWFGNDNSHPLFQFVVSDRYLRRNPYVASPQPLVHVADPPTAPPVYPTSRTVDRFNDLFALDRFTSACSPIIFRDDSLGADVAGAAFICEPVHNLVSRLMLEPDGLICRGRRHPSEQSSEFLSSRDNWFRPTRLMTGPDGGLWVADMYRHVIEHPQWIPEAWQARLNLYAGNDRGRIYRIVRKGTPRNALPDFTQLSELELVAELASGNGWRRDTAQILLVQRERLSAEAERRLGQEAMQGSTPLGRLHAVCTLDGRGALTPTVLLSALRDDNPHVVREAVRIAESHLGSVPAVWTALAGLAGHDDVRVRFQLALTAGESSDSQAASILTRLAQSDAADPWIRAAILSSAKDHAQQLLKSLLQQMPASAERAAIVTDLVATALGEDPVAGFAGIDAVLRPARGTFDDWQMAALAAALDALQRRNVSLKSLEDAEDDTVDATFKHATEMLAHARKISANAREAVERRVIAAQLLGREPGRAEADLELLSGWLSPNMPPELQAVAVEASARTRSDDVPERLLAEWSSAGPQLRSRVLDVLASREAWASALVERLRDGRLRPADFDAAARSRLTDHRNQSLREAARELLGTTTSEDRERVLERYQSVLETEGDATRGAEIFRKRCATCHRHRGIGNDFGAKLAGLQNKSTEALMTAILDPNRAVEAKYAAYAVATEDGRVVSGMIVDETATSISLAKPDGNEEVILRVDIAELSASGKSFMPEGLEMDLPAQDLADVIRFVQMADEAAD